MRRPIQCTSSIIDKLPASPGQFQDREHRYLYLLPKIYGRQPENAPFRLVSVSLRDWLRRPVKFEFCWPWPAFHMSSMSFRYAFLAYASQVGQEESGSESDRFRDKSIQYIKQAIDDNSIAEVFSASYVMLHYAAASEKKQPFANVLTYFDGLTIALADAKKVANDTNEREMIETLWRWSLFPVQGAYWLHASRTSQGFPEEFRLLHKLYSILKTSTCAHCPRFPLRTPSPEAINERLGVLEVYFRFILDYYLAIRKRSDPEQQQLRLEVVQALNGIVAQISELVPQLSQPAKLLFRARDRFLGWPWAWNVPEGRHGELALGPVSTFDINAKRFSLLFGLAMVINDAILVAEQNSLPDAGCGVFLARLCAISLDQSPLPSPLNVVRHLFWAGLYTTTSNEPIGHPYHSKH